MTDYETTVAGYSRGILPHKIFLYGVFMDIVKETLLPSAPHLYAKFNKSVEHRGACRITKTQYVREVVDVICDYPDLVRLFATFIQKGAKLEVHEDRGIVTLIEPEGLAIHYHQHTNRLDPTAVPNKKGNKESTPTNNESSSK